MVSEYLLADDLTMKPLDTGHANPTAWLGEAGPTHYIGVDMRTCIMAHETYPGHTVCGIRQNHNRYWKNGR